MNMPTDDTACRQCAAIVPPHAQSCPHCGASVSPVAPSSDEASSAATSRATPVRSHTSWSAALNNRWLVLCTLFFVTAALGLPLLWASGAFSRGAKVWLSIVVTLYTVLILWLFWLVMVWCVTTIREALL